jgi:hypothetical protein
MRERTSLKVERHKETHVKFKIHHTQVVAGAVAAVVTLGFAVVPVSEASAVTSSPVKTIVKNADTFVNNIRDYFFCESATCKKNRNVEKTTAAKDMLALVSEAKSVATTTVPSSQQPIVKKFVQDVEALFGAYTAYPKQSSAENIARNTGEIYYQSANVGSDTYLLTANVSGATTVYGPWSVGAVAVLYAMQLDTEALNSKSATVADDIYACQNLQLEAKSLSSDTNGPNTTFDTLLATFARTQKEVSADEILILQKKKTKLSSSELSALSASLGTQFKKIVNLQNTLSK